jgi:hypothetical protein
MQEYKAGLRLLLNENHPARDRRLARVARANRGFAPVLLKGDIEAQSLLVAFDRFEKADDKIQRGICVGMNGEIRRAPL